MKINLEDVFTIKNLQGLKPDLFRYEKKTLLFVVNTHSEKLDSSINMEWILTGCLAVLIDL